MKLGKSSRVKVKEKRKNPATEKKIEMIIRQNAALDLRRRGMSYRAISREMRASHDKIPGVSLKSYDSGLAYKDVIDGMRRLMEEQKEFAAENLNLDLQRLDELLEKVYERAIPQGSIPYDPLAVRDVLAILEKRAALLNYKGLFEKPLEPSFNINVDWSQFTAEELLEIRKRIQSGDDPIVVITEIQQARDTKDKV